MIGIILGPVSTSYSVAAPATFAVLDSDGNSHTVSRDVLDSDGNTHTVPGTVLDSDGNSHSPG